MSTDFKLLNRLLPGHPVLLSVLPIDEVEPTPFQRDLSDAHHKRLADVLNKTGRFLDPIIAVVAPKEGFWTPNGRHRLEESTGSGFKDKTFDKESGSEIGPNGLIFELPSPR